MQQACRERTNLRVQLQDTRATVGTLRIIMAVLLQAVNCFFWLAIYNVRIFFAHMLVMGLIMHYCHANFALLQSISRRVQEYTEQVTARVCS